MYLVRRGGYGRLGYPEQENASDPMPLQSILSHIHIPARWVDVDLAQIPEQVCAIASGGWLPLATTE
jgi:hypothetical protein